MLGEKRRITDSNVLVDDLDYCHAINLWMTFNPISTVNQSILNIRFFIRGKICLNSHETHLPYYIGMNVTTINAHLEYHNQNSSSFEPEPGLITVIIIPIQTATKQPATVASQ